MASHFRQCIIIILFCFANTCRAQTVYYPEQSSDVLIQTAKDVATLFNKAIPGSNFLTRSYSSLPASGIILIYDSAFVNNQSCKVEGNGNNILKFSAAQDAGLSFGIYHYLHELGFTFYLPGTLWEKIPKLTTPYKQVDKIVAQKFKYNGWFISGGYNRWVMDKEDVYGGYFGKNGHDWGQYKARNNMGGAYRFSGHRGDIFSNEYVETLKANPCYIACNNGERKVSSQAVPDINNINAENLWASNILKIYTSYKNSVTGAPVLYKNLYHDFNYANEYIGIEVPDGSVFGNSKDNLGCITGNYNGNPYPKESDQQFILANFTASKINALLPEKHFQCYAYFNHADVPSVGISINKNIDVQVVATAFQSETSPVALLNRWYKRHSNISEYYYMNIPQWSGETPLFSLNNYTNTLQRIKMQNSQGLIIEASPAKFATLPFLFAGNRYLQYDINVDSSLYEFTANMFPPAIAVNINQLLKYFGGDNIMNGGKFTADNKYKIPLFLQQLNKAVLASQNADKEVMQRLQEFKAYLHYVVLYYNFINDNRSYQNKNEKAANICLYLAKINNLQLVNSYFLIIDIVNKFSDTSAFYKQYNVTNGTAYNNGNLPLITDEEINNNFSADIFKYAGAVTDYKFENAVDIIKKMDAAGLKPVDKIDVAIGYTNGYNYPNRSEFYFYAPTPGAININCAATFQMPDHGLINVTVEAIDNPLLVILDETITRNHNPGSMNIAIPSAGLYKLSIDSKYKSLANLTVITNGNTFFKGAFYGKGVEYYGDSSWKNLPKYFYVPNIHQLYFSINNACYTNRCLSPDDVKNAFGIKNNYGNYPTIEVSPFDSSLYKISVADSNSASFWKVSQMREYNFCFANISNIEFFAEPKNCNADFTVTVANTNGKCFTRLKATSASSMNNDWKIIDGNKEFTYSNSGTVNMPELLSPNAVITFHSGVCLASKRTRDFKDYLQSLQACAFAAPLPALSNKITVYPNPSSSVFNFKKENSSLVLNRINIYDPQGKKIIDVVNSSSINLSSLPAGIYLYSAQNDNEIVKGKLIKQ